MWPLKNRQLALCNAVTACVDDYLMGVIMSLIEQLALQCHGLAY